MKKIKKLAMLLVIAFSMSMPATAQVGPPPPGGGDDNPVSIPTPWEMLKDFYDYIKDGYIESTGI